MDSNTGDPPPPYTEQNGTTSASRRGRISADNPPEDPPPYESRPDSIGKEIEDTSNQKVLEAEELTEASSSSSSSSAAAAAASSSLQPESESESAPRSSSSFRQSISQARQAYEERKRAKEAATKVDYYEKIYGFVPKNVMSEAEWKQARRDAPKEKAPFRLQAKPWFGGIF